MENSFLHQNLSVLRRCLPYCACMSIIVKDFFLKTVNTWSTCLSICNVCFQRGSTVSQKRLVQERAGSDGDIFLIVITSLIS